MSESVRRPVIEKDSEAVWAAKEDAEKAIGYAVFHAIGCDENANGALRLIGIEMALLTCAARVARMQAKICGAQDSFEIFIQIAGDMYALENEHCPPELEPTMATKPS